MPKYIVRVWKTEAFTADHVVDADDAEQAADIAREEALEKDLNWCYVDMDVDTDIAEEMEDEEA